MKPCLIIGQGLAGSFIALELIKRNIPCFVIDAGDENSASRKAAGLWNPVSFKRITAHDSVHHYLKSLQEHWQRWTPILGDDFLHPLPLVRIFPDQTYANDWDVKSDSPKMAPLLNTPIQEQPPWKMPFGAGIVSQAGWLDVPLYLKKVQLLLSQKNSFLKAQFVWNDLEMHNEGLQYNGQEYSQVIFCTGLFDAHPLLQTIPLIPNKGHLLEITAPHLTPQNIIHYGNFCVPLGSERFRIGSSYEWEKADDCISTDIVQELFMNFGEHCDTQHSLISTYVGHRPTVKDRNPIIGSFPEHPRMAIFNGLGTKGVLQGPYLASLLADHLYQQQPIPKAFSIDRFLNKDRLNTP